jgi:hypothetical protein
MWSDEIYLKFSSEASSRKHGLSGFPVKFRRTWGRVHERLTPVMISKGIVAHSVLCNFVRRCCLRRTGTAKVSSACTRATMKNTLLSRLGMPMWFLLVSGLCSLNQTSLLPIVGVTAVSCKPRASHRKGSRLRRSKPGKFSNSMGRTIRCGGTNRLSFPRPLSSHTVRQPIVMPRQANDSLDSPTWLSPRHDPEGVEILWRAIIHMASWRLLISGVLAKRWPDVFLGTATMAASIFVAVRGASPSKPHQDPSASTPINELWSAGARLVFVWGAVIYMATIRLTRMDAFANRRSDVLLAVATLAASAVVIGTCASTPHDDRWSANSASMPLDEEQSAEALAWGHCFFTVHAIILLLSEKRWPNILVGTVGMVSSIFAAYVRTVPTPPPAMSLHRP